MNRARLYLYNVSEETYPPEGLYPTTKFAIGVIHHTRCTLSLENMHNRTMLSIQLAFLFSKKATTHSVYVVFFHEFVQKSSTPFRKCHPHMHEKDGQPRICKGLI